jgi:hypothetical protein
MPVLPTPSPTHAPPEVSPDGAMLNTPTGWLIDAQGNRFALVRSQDKGLQIRINAFVDPVTANVAVLMMDKGRCYQRNHSSDWYGYGGSPGDWEGPIQPPPINPPKPPITSGVYYVENGRFYDPNGQRWHGRGPNLRFMNWPDNQNVVMHHPISDRANCLPVTQTFPGVNLVRFDAFESMAQIGAAAPNNIIPYVDSLVKQGVVVEVECHVYPTVLSGGDLDRVCGWYDELARHYAKTPQVIWGTQNEPGGNPDNEISRIYDAIRNAGNDNLILMCPEGGWSWSSMNPSNYGRYRNVAWDFHYYGWMPNYSQNQGDCDRKLQSMIDTGMGFHSADGPIPSICGEFGICGFQGDNAQFVEGAFWADPNGFQIIEAVYRNPNLGGWMQWFWNTPETSQTNGISFLIKPDGNYNGSRLTDHGGTQCRDAIARGAPG